MALGDLLSLPAAATGLAPISGAGAWGYGSWAEASASLATDIYVIGLTFQLTNSPVSLDTTYEQLFEIGTGASGAEVTKIQIPYSFRSDTVAYGYYKDTIKYFFPEPLTISAGTRVAVRATDSIAAAITYNGVKILYREGAGVTAIGNEVQKIWNIRQAVPDTSQSIWNVRFALGDTSQYIWNIKASIGDTIQHIWHIRAALGKPVQLVHNILVSIGDTSQYVWNVLISATAVGDIVELVWHTKEAINKTSQSIWNVRFALGDTVQSLFNVKVFTGKTSQAIWNILTPVSDTVQSIWRIRQTIGKTFQSIWNVVANLQTAWKTLQTLWGIRSRRLDILTQVSIAQDLNLASSITRLRRLGSKVWRSLKLTPSITEE